MKAAQKLRKFRQQCERDAGAPAHDIEIPLVSVLDDVCRLLAMPARKRRSILGRANYARLQDARVWEANPDSDNTTAASIEQS